MNIYFGRLIFGFFYVFLASLVFEGPIRYLFSFFNVNILVYLPKVILISVLFFYVIILGQANKRVWYLLSVMLLFFVVGVFNLGIKQALFGLWVFVPFIYGLMFSGFIFNVKYYKWYIKLFLFCFAGVFFGLFIHYPWSGLQVSVLGKAVTASLEWDTMGINRDAGFSRASYSAAAQLICLAVLIIYMSRSIYTNILIWVLCGIGLVMTTTKGAFGAWIVLSIYYLIYFGTKQHLLRYIYSVVVIILFGLLCIILPLTTYFYGYSSGFQSIIVSFIFSSFMDRLVWMWPDSFHLLEIGKISSLFFGRGIGGIGASQSYFEPQYYRAADNIFVYIMVDFGFILAVIFMIYLMATALRKGKGHQYLFVIPVIVMLFSYGLVTNIIEDPFLSALLGCVLVPYGKYGDNCTSMLLPE